MSVSFNLDSLRTILRSCAGEPESIDLFSDIAATTFEDLGYESIALIETAAHIEREIGVALEDEVITELQTPQEFVDYVNTRLGH